MNAQQNPADNQGLSEIVKKMAGRPVLVIGDIMLDRFVYGTVDRISPESPVPVLNIKREDCMLGGAGNALASLAGLGLNSHMLAVIGEDEEGTQIWNRLEALGVSPDSLVTDPMRPTTVKTRFLSGHQQLLRADFENNKNFPKDIESAILGKAEALIPEMQVVLISDYGKGLLSENISQSIIRLCKECDIPVIIDPKGADYSKYRGASAITPNKKELQEAAGMAELESDADVQHASKKLIEACDFDCIYATRSKEGMSVIRKAAQEASVHLKTHAQEVYDVSGAGDVVIATIAGALAAGADAVQAARLANMAGGIAVSKVGTAPIRVDELFDALHADEYHQSEEAGGHSMGGFICAKDQWEKAFEHIQRWRAQGLRVGFTNGCFDILHVGHVSYLNQARNECDRLVVGVNTDVSVRALKGPDRPVHEENARAGVLAGLGAVDMVVLFGGETAEDDQTANTLIGKLQPEIYFKGGDYKVEDIPEAKTVQAYGGTVKVLANFEGHSTTSSIEKMKDHAA